ncbi:PAS domain-containing protein, partial [Desulforudis sp. 1190]
MGKNSDERTGPNYSAERLEQVQAAFLTLFENTGLPTCLIEEDTTISLCNEDFARFAGYPRAEIEGRMSWTAFVAEEDLERMRGYHILRRRDPQAAPRNYEFRFVDRHGRSKFIWVTVALIPGTRQSIASFMDITEIKRKEEALRISEANYHAIFDNVNDTVFVHDPATGSILEANSKVAELCGYTPEEACRLSVGELSAGFPPFTQEHAMGWIARAAESPQLFEWMFRTKDGRLLWLEVNLKRAVIGGRDRLLAVVRDITARKAREARLAAE